jgi:hypothetical protein
VSRTSLTRYAPLMRETDPNGAHRIAKQQWHDIGAIVLLPDQIKRLAWQDRDLLNGIAAKLYGPRQENKTNG